MTAKRDEIWIILSEDGELFWGGGLTNGRVYAYLNEHTARVEKNRLKKYGYKNCIVKRVRF